MRVSQVRWLGRLEKEYKGEEELAQLQAPSPHLGPHGPATLSYRLRGWLCEPGLPIKGSPPAPATLSWLVDGHMTQLGPVTFFLEERGLKGTPKGPTALMAAGGKSKPREAGLQDGGRAQMSAFETLGQVMPEVSTLNSPLLGLKICLFH